MFLLRVCGAIYIFTWRGEDASTRKILKVDHPITICFVYLVYMQRVVLVPSARIFLVLASSYKMYKLQKDHSIMLTAFVRKILVLGTNQTKMVSGRLVSNHSNTGYPLIFIWCYHKLITVIIAVAACQYQREEYYHTKLGRSGEVSLLAKRGGGGGVGLVTNSMPRL